MHRRARSRIVASIAAFTLLACVPALAAPGERVAWNDLPRDPSWTADLPNGSTLWGPAYFPDGVAVGVNRGVAVFPRACPADCEPLWRSDLPGARFHGYQVAVGAGVVVASDGEKLLAVFPADCRTDGGVCEPTWTAQGRLLQPTIHDGAVLALISEGDRAGLAVFPITCEDPCTPTFTWTRERRSWLLVDIVVANDVAYFVMNPRLYGLSLGCASGGACGLAFRARRGDNPTTPAVVDGRIVFTSGEVPREVVAYEEGCALPCDPVWTATTAFNDSPPVPGPGIVFTTSRDRLAAWTVDCTDPCLPAWTARMPGVSSIEHVTDRWAVAISPGDRRVAVFPVDCSGRCHPQWSQRFRRRAYAVSGLGNDFVVTLDERVLGFPLWCGARCDPEWRGRLPGGEPWWPDLRVSSLIVYARGGGVTSAGGVLTGFVALTP